MHRKEDQSGIVNKDTRAHFDDASLAAQYDEIFGKGTMQLGRILFEEAKGFLGPGIRLLDLGIGTGAGAEDFVKTGAEIYGVDFSAEMLKKCEEKGFARELKCVDMERAPLPYADAFFDVVAANAVLFYLRDLTGLFQEVGRVLSSGGYFAFNADALETGYATGVIRPVGEGVFARLIEPSGITAYAHSYPYLKRLVPNSGMKLVKDFPFPAFPSGREVPRVIYHLFLARKPK